MHPLRAGADRSVVAASRALAWNLALEAELLRVTSGLEAVGIEVVVLKGVPLARRLGRGLDHRAIGDNDLLVRPEAVPEVEVVLQGLGYEPPPPRFIDLDAFATSRPSPAGAFWVDVHWGAFLTPLYPVDLELVWSHIERVELPRGPVTTFDAALTIVHLAAHYAQHRFRQPRVLLDLAAAWNRWADEIDHEELQTVTRATGQHPTLTYSLRVAQEHGLLQRELPAMRSFQASVVHRLAPNGRGQSDASPSDYVGHALVALLARPLPALRWLRALAFPPVERLPELRGQGRMRLRYLNRLLNPLRSAHRRRRRS